MAGQQPFIPPSHDNVINSHGVTMSSALDAVMSKEGQSYEEFLKSFTYISKEDVKAPVDVIGDSALGEVRQSTGAKRQPIVFTNQEKLDRDVDKSVKARVPVEETEELEEEILEEGTKTSIMSSMSASLGVSGRLQFDNFVVDEEGESPSELDDNDDDNDDDDDIGGGYIASFGGPAEPSGNQNRDLNSTENPSAQQSDPDPLTKEDNSDEATEDEGRVVHLYPGEIQDEPSKVTIKDLQNDRQLDFTARFMKAEDRERVSGNLQDELCTDEVQPFSLDEDFDYDNVILTPKFTTQEMEIMRNMMEHNRLSEGVTT